MEKCEARGVIGEGCRRIPGRGRESCYLWNEAQEEPVETIPYLRPSVKRQLGCSFREETLKYLDQKTTE